MRFHIIPADGPLPTDADEKLRQFLAYWRSKGAPGRSPRRRDIDAVEIARLLPAIALLDVEPEDFRFSLVGQDIIDHYGPIRGRRFRELMTGAQLQQTLDEHRTCVAAGLPVFTRQTEQSANNESWQLYQRLLTPLAAQDGALTSIAAIMAFRRYRE